MTKMDNERVNMLKTLGKIQDFYFGINEGVAAGSDANTDDTVRGEDEREDYVQMSYSEFQ